MFISFVYILTRKQKTVAILQPIALKNENEI